MSTPDLAEDLMREAHALRVRYGTFKLAAEASGIPQSTLEKRSEAGIYRLGLPEHTRAKRVKSAWQQSTSEVEEPAPEPDPITEQYGEDVRRVEGKQQGSWVQGPAIELISGTNNLFLIGACGDLHAGSKYTRWDVREDLFRRYERIGVQAVFDTGNWIDGDASFNRHDVEVQGLARQVALLVERHPRIDCPIYAVTGDDHEGWYEQREGIDVGWYCEQQMRKAGHDWHNLGYMEAHVKLTNANTGASSIMTVVHPGGGSAYALSYTIQKIVESYEGGEKPAVGLFGHYHKMISGLDRNVWWLQTGCAQDQTPFMRKKKLAAHVGGAIVGMEQDPETGAIISFTPQLIRYFNKGYYDVSQRWSKHGDVAQQPRSVGGL